MLNLLSYHTDSIVWMSKTPHTGRGGVSQHANSVANYANQRCHDFLAVISKLCLKDCLKRECSDVKLVCKVYAEPVSPAGLASCLHEAPSSSN